jgi:transcriptional regulator with XRE-family HTH domain
MRTVGAVLASRIREVREMRGLTQAELAERLEDLGLQGASQPMVARMEKPDGARAANLGTSHLLAVAMALNVAPVHLLTPSEGGQRVQLPGCEPVLDEDGEPVRGNGDRVRTQPTTVYGGRLRGWIRGQWPLRHGQDDDWDYYNAVPREERDALIELKRRRGPDEPLPATERYLRDQEDDPHV